MCRSQRNTLASQPTSRNPTTSPAAAAQADVHHGHRHPGRRRHSTTNSASIPTTSSSSSTSTTAAGPSSSSSNLDSSISSTVSGISTLRLSLSISENPTLYPFTDISAATNNFLSKRLPTSSSSSSWRCTLRGKDVVIFQRPFPFRRRQDDDADPVVVNLPSRLSTLCKCHHSSLINLLGASLSGGGGDYIYLVYPYVAGASLEECLRNPRNPNFTPLSKWISRMQIAADLADGLDYIHNHCKTIHNRIKTSSIIVTESNFNAKICHFGAADLAGEIPSSVTTATEKKKKKLEEEILISSDEESKSKDNDDISSSLERLQRRRSNSRSNRTRFQGTRGYIAPEVIAGGRISQKSDVFAFGVVILELLSGKEPFKYRMKKGENKEYERISLIDTARDAIGGTEEEMELAEEEEEKRRRVRIRQWVDRRLRDSFPVEVAEKLVRLALQCVEEEPYMRPEMTKVAGKVSKLFLDSKVWEDNLRLPGADDFSVTYGPR